MSIPPEFIDRVRDTADIVEIIGQYVNLKKKGANYLGLCPFHTEKTPSFSVSPSKGIYKCFGCGAGGNVFTFIMQREKMLFPEAVEYLAKKLGMEVPRVSAPGTSSRRENLFTAVQKGHNFFRQWFNKNPLPLEYLKSRNFHQAVAEKMELGFAPDQWDAFAKSVKSNYKDYISVGLLRERDGGGYYDYFRNRLIFPIKDLAGRVCAFGGRFLGKDDENTAKYINSPENPIYNKGSLLYGLSQNCEKIRKSEFVYLVEGYTDLLRLLTCEIENCAAGLGTAFTLQQAKLLRRYTQKCVILFDGDEAGVKAAVRTGKILLKAGMEVEIIQLPSGYDPDSYLCEKGKEGLKSIPQYSIFKFQLEASGRPTNSRIERERIARNMLESAACITDEMKRSLALEEISDMVSIPTDALRMEIRKLKRGAIDEYEDKTTNHTIQFSPMELPERDLIRLLINNAQAGEDVFTKMDQDLISNPILRKIFKSMKSHFLKEDLQDVHSFMNEFEDIKIQNFIADCAIWEPPADVDILLKHNLNKLNQMKNKRQISALKMKIKEAEAQGDDTTELLKELVRLKKSIES